MTPERWQRGDLARRYDGCVLDPILASAAHEVKVRSRTARLDPDVDFVDMDKLREFAIHPHRDTVDQLGAFPSPAARRQAP